MSNFQFQKATKMQSKLRLAVFGPSGSGKTFSSLRIASGMGGQIAFIDTERGSASKYADRFEFDVLELPRRDINTYIAAMQAAGEAGYENLIIDSLSHAWQELLEEIDQLARSKYRGNTWSAWSEGTPKQRKLVDAILDFPGHIIVTMRSKTEWTTGDDGKGKSKPIRVGLAPEQGKGVEYEFDLLMEISTDHIANIIKDRTGKYQDLIIDRPGEEFGKELIAWLSSGEPVPERPIPQPTAPVQPYTNGNGSSRPYHPDNLRDRLMSTANIYAGKSATSAQRGLVAAMMELPFAGEGAELKRKAILSHIFDVESLNDITDPVILGMLNNWLKPTKDSGGAYQPDPMAVKELHLAYDEALRDQGQMELPLDPDEDDIPEDFR